MDADKSSTLIVALVAIVAIVTLVFLGSHTAAAPVAYSQAPVIMPPSTASGVPSSLTAPPRSIGGFAAATGIVPEGETSSDPSYDSEQYPAQTITFSGVTTGYWLVTSSEWTWHDDGPNPISGTVNVASGTVTRNGVSTWEYYYDGSSQLGANRDVSFTFDRKFRPHQENGWNGVMQVSYSTDSSWGMGQVESKDGAIWVYSPDAVTGLYISPKTYSYGGGWMWNGDKLYYMQLDTVTVTGGLA